LVGSYGGGSYVNDDRNSAGIKYDMPLGDRTLVHFEGSGINNDSTL